MKPNRREFFQALGATAAGLSVAPIFLSSSCSRAVENENQLDNQVLFIGDDIAVADTVYGKVRGYLLRDIYYFWGMPYGADTSGKNRFMPPQKPEPWTDIFPAVWWGNSAPQNMENGYANRYQSFQDHWNYDDVSEDCLRINVFTPGSAGNRRCSTTACGHFTVRISASGSTIPTSCCPIQAEALVPGNFPKKWPAHCCSL